MEIQALAIAKLACVKVSKYQVKWGDQGDIWSFFLVNLVLNLKKFASFEIFLLNIKQRRPRTWGPTSKVWHHSQEYSIKQLPDNETVKQLVKSLFC